MHMLSRWSTSWKKAWWLALLGWSVEAFAASGEPSLAPHFQVSGAADGVDALPLKSTQVDATLVGVIAEVRVIQTYRNEGGTPLEARYVFPGSTRAAVHAMTMQVGDRRIEAQVREKAEARRTYEAAKAAGRTTSLLEAQRSNVFEMNVANIIPGDTVVVELRYTEMLVPTDGEYEWVFPTTVGPRYTRAGATHEADVLVGAGASPGIPYTTKVSEEPVFTLAVDVVAGVPIQALSCASHRIETANEGGRTRMRLPASGAPAMNRDFILRYRLAGDTLAGGLLLDDWQGEKFFLLTVQPPARVAAELVPARDYVFVVDVSGSMQGFPLDTAKSLLSELLLTLRSRDTFNVLLFSGGSAVLSETPVAATPEAIAAALALIDRQKAGGGTELLPALERTLALPKRAGVARSIVVVTDGYVSVEAEAYALVRERHGDANLFAFGIGSSVNRELIERLARAGRAEPAVIETPGEAPRAAERFRAMIEAPVLTGVQTEFEGFKTHDLHPAQSPDVLAQRPLVIVGKWSGPAAGRVTLRGVTGRGPWETAVEVSRAIDLNGCGVLAQLWARERLELLRDLHAVDDERERRRAEIVQLGLRYQLLTPFTSFIAVDTLVRTSGAPAKQVNQPASLPQGMSARTVGELVPTTPEPETIGLAAIAAVMIGWILWRRRAVERNRGSTAHHVGN